LKPRVTRPPTRAFLRSDLTEAVKRLRGCDFPAFQSGCSKKLWLEAWLRYVYETGARFTDAHALRAIQLVPGGVAWTASKTGLPVIKRISPAVEALLSTLAAQSPDGTVFSWAVSRRHAFAEIRRAFPLIGLTGGKTQWLRRSGATHAEAERRGAAKEYLAHRTDGLAERSYLDYTQLLDGATRPPDLGID
jgi:integrase